MGWGDPGGAGVMGIFVGLVMDRGKGVKRGGRMGVLVHSYILIGFMRRKGNWIVSSAMNFFLALTRDFSLFSATRRTYELCYWN